MYKLIRRKMRQLQYAVMCNQDDRTTESPDKPVIYTNSAIEKNPLRRREGRIAANSHMSERSEFMVEPVRATGVRILFPAQDVFFGSLLLHQGKRNEQPHWRSANEDN